MRTLKLFAIALVFGCPLFALADAPPAPTTHDQQIAISDAFIPSGFDSGSDAFVVISGLLPNGCYHYKESNVTNVSTTVHEVRTMATVSGGMCPMVIVPFTRDVQLGKLISGDHTIRFVSSDGTFWEKHLTIE